MTAEPDAGPGMPDRGRILVVDDEPAIRRLLRRILGDQHDMFDAASVAEARELLATEACDLVLCDVNMSGESGLALVRAIADGAADVAVVMVTGVDDPGVAREALATGAYGYLLKPFTSGQVIITVAAALHHRALAVARRDALARERLHELVAERERIAIDLHRSVIDRLFKVTVTLGSAMQLIERPEAKARVQAGVDEIDASIKQIVSTILSPDEGPPPPG